MSANERNPDEPPPVLAAAASVFFDLCLGRMPDVARLRAALKEQGFKPEPEDIARGLARPYALDQKLVSVPLRNMQHGAWRKEHQGVPVAMLLSTTDSDLGEVVFVSALFGGATEAEAVRLVERITQMPIAEGGLAHDPDGKVLRRAFWKLPPTTGLRAVALSGPEDPEARKVIRALIGFNLAS